MGVSPNVPEERTVFKLLDKVRLLITRTGPGPTPGEEAAAFALGADLLIGSAAVESAAAAKVEEAARELEAAGNPDVAARLRANFRKLVEARYPGKAIGAIGPVPTDAGPSPPTEATSAAIPDKPRRGRPRRSESRPASSTQL